MKRGVVICMMLLTGLCYGQQTLRGTLMIRKKKPLEHLIIGQWKLDHVRHDYKINNRPGWMLAFDQRGMTTEIVNQDTIFGQFKILPSGKVRLLDRRCTSTKEPHPDIDFSVPRRGLKTDTITLTRHVDRFYHEDWVYVRKL